jgi:hypothetical protein
MEFATKDPVENVSRRLRNRLNEILGIGEDDQTTFFFLRKKSSSANIVPTHDIGRHVSSILQNKKGRFDIGVDPRWGWGMELNSDE